MEHLYNDTEDNSTSHEKIRPVEVSFDNMEPGYPGVTIYYSDGSKNWFDVRSRRKWEENNNIPDEERVDNLPKK